MAFTANIFDIEWDDNGTPKTDKLVIFDPEVTTVEQAAYWLSVNDGEDVTVTGIALSAPAGGGVTRPPSGGRF